MHYTHGNPADCKHSKGRNLPKFGKDTLAVYSTCKNPDKRPMYKGYFLEHYQSCENCTNCVKN